ncbi:hypothetical protein [Massilia psychrophila]|uniref:hypothetical protein n=1 Tax=Massilia psychrophila TaxID=1603353 RepID=UPI00117C1363|nr:hypothetical protein [Massilia psychrophila]
MDAWLRLSPQPGGRFSGGFGRFFSPQIIIRNFLSASLLGVQKQNNRAGDWLIAAQLGGLLRRFRG